MHIGLNFDRVCTDQDLDTMGLFLLWGTGQVRFQERQLGNLDYDPNFDSVLDLYFDYTPLAVERTAGSLLMLE